MLVSKEGCVDIGRKGLKNGNQETLEFFPKNGKQYVTIMFLEIIPLLSFFLYQVALSLIILIEHQLMET